LRRHPFLLISPACVSVACVLWAMAGCDSSPGTDAAWWSAERLVGLVEAELATADLDAAFDAGLLSDPWTGARAEGDHTSPDAVWYPDLWIMTRELPVTYNCGIPPIEWVEINYGTGYGARKTGVLTHDPLVVEAAVETADGWQLTIACGQDDDVTSLYLPMRVYGDHDNACLGEVNLGVSGYIQMDRVTFMVEIVDGVVQDPTVALNDLHVHVDLFGNGFLDGLLSDIISSIAGWTQGYMHDVIGQAVKGRVEAAYVQFAAWPL